MGDDGGRTHAWNAPVSEPILAAHTRVCDLCFLEWPLPHHWHRYRPRFGLSLRGPSFLLLSLPVWLIDLPQAFGRPVHNMKKFEEGVFSDLRNLKPGVDASLEEPKVGSWLFLFLFPIHIYEYSRLSWIFSSNTSASAPRRNKKSFTGSQSPTTASSSMLSTATSNARKWATPLLPVSSVSRLSPSNMTPSAVSTISSPNSPLPTTQSRTKMPISAKATPNLSSALPELTISISTPRTAK